ncbi:MAG: ribonuclease HII [Deltaproteobacteria bacterium]|nr:ribonuclease HII [Deltaproteobacteria bacterium]
MGTNSDLPDLEYEKRYGFPRKVIAGIDEVGRGCIAGPVVAAVACLPPEIDFNQNPWIREVRDSKLLTPLKREMLSLHLTQWLLGFAIGLATVNEIDNINILQASFLAMERALEILSKKISIDQVLVDGKFVPQHLKGFFFPIIKGDQKCLSIACASIIAKVYRDHLMEQLDAQYPNYGLSKHKGYPTPMHKAALRTHGVSIIHRKSFEPVRVLLSV